MTDQERFLAEPVLSVVERIRNDSAEGVQGDGRGGSLEAYLVSCDLKKSPYSCY